jgi:hypothetical protein
MLRADPSFSRRLLIGLGDHATVGLQQSGLEVRGEVTLGDRPCLWLHTVRLPRLPHDRRRA